MITETESNRGGLPHAVFLQRVADEPATSPDVRLGQGAFLTLRFVDLLAPDREPPAPDVFRYQWAATERYCAELAGEGTEAAHLSCIVRATGEAHQTGERHQIAPALFAYALYLEQESHLEEAEDALLTLLSLGEDLLRPADLLAAWMRLGRVRRLKTEFDQADEAYNRAGIIASRIGDRQALLFSRIGHCNVLYFRGNLSEADHNWRAVLADAQNSGFKRIEGEAEHGLGNVLHRRGLTHEGIPHLWRAYELYEEPEYQLRALGDLGLSFAAIGNIESAEQALREVVRRAPTGEAATNAKIELMYCASFRQDRLGFERWRESAIQGFEQVAPNIRADYHLKAGIGLARFGFYPRAENELRQASAIAVAHGLNELAFRVDRMLGGLKECGVPESIENAASESRSDSASLKEVSASLAALGS